MREIPSVSFGQNDWSMRVAGERGESGIVRIALDPRMERLIPAHETPEKRQRKREKLERIFRFVGGN